MPAPPWWWTEINALLHGYTYILMEQRYRRAESLEAALRQSCRHHLTILFRELKLLHPLTWMAARINDGYGGNLPFNNFEASYTMAAATLSNTVADHLRLRQRLRRAER